MLFLIFAGTVLLIFGVLFLFSPQTIRNLNHKMDKVLINFDKKFYDLRVGVGVSLVLVSCLSFFIVYFLIRKF